MRTVLVYCSQTGFTATYARWLGEELGVEPLAFADRSSASVAEADTVVFLSWFHAGGLKETSWFRKLMDGAPEKRYAVVGVGAYPMPSGTWPQSAVDEAFERAFPESRYPALAHFYCQGGFDFDRLCMLDKLAMRMFFRMEAPKAADDERAAFALKMMKQGFDGTRREYLAPVVEHLRGQGPR